MATRPIPDDDNNPIAQAMRDDPRMRELLWRQHREAVTFHARQSQEFLRLALTIRREIERQD